jgi:thiol:disulfide interchange protein DsbC
LTKRGSSFAVFGLSCAMLFVISLSGYSLAAEPGIIKENKDCKTLSNQGIKDVLTKLKVPDAKVLSITESPIQEFCEIVFENMGRTEIFYLDRDKKYFIYGSLVEISSMSNKTQERFRRIRDSKRIDIAKIPMNDVLILGEIGASKKAVVFTDPDCPFCGQLHQTMKQIVAKRKDIAFYIKFLPLPMHKDAYWKAKSIVCNKSLKMLEDNFEKKEIPRTECATEEVNNSAKLAATFGISGTPSLILPDGRIREGAMPEAELLNLIDGKK